MNEILESHAIESSQLRADDFAGFFMQRKMALLDIVSTAMGKAPIDSPETPVDDQPDGDEDET